MLIFPTYVGICIRRIEEGARVNGMATQNRGAEALKAKAISRASEITSAAGIAAALNQRSVPTVRGGDFWQAVQVQRVLARAA
jgi:arginine deiminase